MNVLIEKQEEKINLQKELSNILEKKIKLFNMTQPKATKVREDTSFSGFNTDKYLNYTIKIEELDEQEKEIRKKILLIDEYIKNEISILKQMEILKIL